MCYWNGQAAVTATKLSQHPRQIILVELFHVHFLERNQKNYLTFKLSMVYYEHHFVVPQASHKTYCSKKEGGDLNDEGRVDRHGGEGGQDPEGVG
jgi:hypothetical protein